MQFYGVSKMYEVTLMAYKIIDEVLYGACQPECPVGLFHKMTSM